jgi:hypothetical protein
MQLTTWQQVNERNDVLSKSNFLCIKNVTFIDDSGIDVGKKRKKRAWTPRSKNWLAVAEHYHEYGYDSTLKTFTEEFNDCTPHAAYQRLKKWSTDRQQNKTDVNDSRRQSILGKELEVTLLAQINSRRNVGLCVDDDILRTLIVALLLKEDKMELLRRNGGVHTFGQGWCSRFWRRHNLSSKVAGTKMREETPADFDKKRDVYIDVGKTVPVNVPVVLNRAVVLKMKVADLKSALSARGMSTNGQKTELVLRLVDALHL